MTAIKNNSTSLKLISRQELYKAHFGFQSPFVMRLLDESEPFFAKKIVRVLPKKRMVIFGRWQAKNVVAKLFFDEANAKSHLEKEAHGIHILQKHHIPTASLLYEGMSEDRRIYILIFEQLEADSLLEAWENKKNANDLLPNLQAVIKELATQHVFGIVQKDLHFKNFLLKESTVYTLDGAKISLFPPLLPKEMSIHYVALFLSQLGVGLQAQQEKLFEYYAKLRGFLLKEEERAALFQHIKKWDRFRFRNFKKKIFRSCSDFFYFRKKFTFGMVDRQHLSPELINFIENPDAFFSNPSAILKAGRSSTVIKVTINQREYVIKRYNMKNIFHRIRRLLRQTRAKKSWYFAQKLKLFGVATAHPVAFIEKKFLCFHGKSYYVMEYISGEHAGHYLDRENSDEKKSSLMNAMISLLKQMLALHMTQSDLKITNILIDKNENPVLIDLDGAKEHRSQASLDRAFQKDIDRFLKNFEDPLLLDKIKTGLGETN